MSSEVKSFPAWHSRWTFILAATGSAVGLGNIWKFPYIAGENGGGAFVLVYLACILLLGIPVMVAEVMLGRSGRQSPINAMRSLTSAAGLHGFWNGIGWLGVVAGLLILSYYSVIAGWALAYIPEIATGRLQGESVQGVQELFNGLLQNPRRLVFWHSVFMLMTVGVVTVGVTRGLGVAVRVLMPLLFVLLVILLIFSYRQGDFARGFYFLFSPNFSALSLRGVLEALGHSFFTLSLGMGAIMAYGAYMPADASIGKTVLVVGFFDTLVALMAGMAIFPIVFAHGGIDPAAGPELLFISLPVAFGAMPGGILIGGLFFILVTIAAWSSAISLIEPGVAWLIETRGFNRFTANLLLGGMAWVLGLGTVLSFNEWDQYKFAGMTFFEGVDFLTSRIMLPLTGLFIAVFVGWILAPAVSKKELNGGHSRAWSFWYWVLRYICPPAITVVLVVGLYDSFV
ncbi:MAG: sodium-dependent transporter [Gammaproteobacteria bacterium]|nr:MAG: sodium-dependent transporter [Gammaproteobacteria bacterium]RLA52435.1 MAG: sodium-dependent transporter [Gammaproteobacteria bacterium]